MQKNGGQINFLIMQAPSTSPVVFSLPMLTPITCIVQQFSNGDFKHTMTDILA